MRGEREIIRCVIVLVLGVKVSYRTPGRSPTPPTYIRNISRGEGEAMRGVRKVMRAVGVRVRVRIRSLRDVSTVVGEAVRGLWEVMRDVREGVEV